MAKTAPGGRAAVLAAKAYRKKENLKAKANRDRRAGAGAAAGEGGGGAQ